MVSIPPLDGLRTILGDELYAYWGLGDLFVGNEIDGARWMLRHGLSWYYGDLIGEAMADIVETVGLSVYPPYTPQWA